MKEIWKDVVGFEGKYKVSSEGRLISAKTNKELRAQCLPNKNYLRAYLCVKDKKYWKVQVSRLVYTHFIGQIPDGKEIDHIDRNPKNNSVSNLRCVSKTENQFNRVKSKKKRYIRTYFNGYTFYYSVTVNGEIAREFGFKSAKDAYCASQKRRIELAQKHDLEVVDNFE